MPQETNPQEDFQSTINGYIVAIMLAIYKLLDKKYPEGLANEILEQVKEDESMKQRTLLILQDKIQELVAMWDQKVQAIGNGTELNPKGQRIIAGFKGIKGTPDNLAK